MLVAVTSAKNDQGVGGTCICVLALSSQKPRLVRPIPSRQSSASGWPFWPMSSIFAQQIGMPVTFNAVSETMVDDSAPLPHCNEDTPCLELPSVESSASGSLFELLSPIAYASIDGVWPKSLRPKPTTVLAHNDIPSLCAVFGSIGHIHRRSRKFWANLDVGTVLRNVRCTSLEFAFMDLSTVVNKPGLLLLGLARPNGTHGAPQSNATCAILLIGWVPQPTQQARESESQSVVSSIFGLGPRSNQDASPEELRWCIGKYLLNEIEQCAPCFSLEDRKALSDMKQLLEAPNDAEALLASEVTAAVIWFPAYQCAVVFTKTEAYSPASLFPGFSWNLVTSTPSERGRTFCVLGHGSIATEKLEQFCFQGGKNEAKEPGAVLRYLHKLTQASVEATSGLCYALEVAERAKRHDDRSNWRLVKAVACFALERLSAHERAAVVYKHVLARLCLWVTWHQVDLLSSDSACPERLDRLMRMLTKSAHKGAKLAEQCFEAHDISASVQAIRLRIDGIVKEQKQCRDAEFSLPMLSELMITHLQLTLPTVTPAETSGLDASTLIQRAIANLDCRTAMHPMAHTGILCSASLSAIHEWSAKLMDDFDRQHFCRHFEDLMVRSCLCSTSSQLHGLDCLLPEHAPALEKALDAYQSASQTLADGAVCKVEQRSVMILVIWIGCCLFHSGMRPKSLMRCFGLAYADCVVPLCLAVAKRSHPELSNYDMALLPEKLGVLVLREKPCMDAALKVHHYIASNQCSGKPVYSLRYEAPTFEFSGEPRLPVGMASRLVSHLSSNRSQTYRLSDADSLIVGLVRDGG